MNRRGFLKTLGVAGATVACPRPTHAAQPAAGGKEPYGVLVDTTRCVGCNTCTYSCAEANKLPEPVEPENVRKTTTDQWTVVNCYSTEKGDVYVKRQCMHCVLPACDSACLTAAMNKTPEGPVEWRGNKCMGCRFCMVSCPFDGPRFEYSSANPRIRKCVMCVSRVRKGQEPACVENCPEGALQFGKRSDLIAIARKRIAENPDQYVNHIYGEHEVGGTSWLYLASVPFEKLGFKTDVGTEAYPTLTAGFLYGVPIVLTVAPAMMYAVSRLGDRNGDGHGDEGEEDRK